ncbi:MAG: CDP-glucose 4,6-dehydratase [Candidatus Altiarchaeota archaeon]|nr:CDP-glucose 4,6-dehydratase [Candidatus Altiarchaeota archaeon]
MEDMERLKFWKGKKVLVTGHTGFKGAWLTAWLNNLKADVAGFSLEKYPNDLLYNSTGVSSRINDARGNIQDYAKLKSVFDRHKPQVVFHLAAQSLVRKSYDIPLETVRSNALGTANLLECIRLSDSVKCAVVITSDKCYRNNEWVWGYREDDAVGGYDPYSCSKGCAELLVDSYRKSFLKKQSKLVASARAGNVIGGGDFAQDRLIPDCVKALMKKQRIMIRNPNSTRPWQHVLEPLDGYLTLAERMWREKKHDEAWNFGPHMDSIRPVSEVVRMFVDKWGEGRWYKASTADRKHEARSLALDISKAYFTLGWRPKLSLDEAVSLTVEWYKNYQKSDVYDLCINQIERYEQK